MNLDHGQRAAAYSSAPSISVTAGPGSGKTAMLLQRAAHLAAQPGDGPVLVAAYTRRAALELRQRLERMDLPDSIRDRIRIDTLHGIAAGIVQENACRLPGGARGLSICGQADEEELLQQARRQGRTIKALLRDHGLVTYRELIIWAGQLLQDGHGESVAALLLDEAQDLTAEEWLFAELLRPARWATVGDPGQEIFRWRGSAGRIHPPEPYARHTLAVNYRSTRAITLLLDRIRQDGLGQVSYRGWGGSVQVARTADDEQIARNVLSMEEPPAILCRTKERLAGFAELLEGSRPVHAPALAGRLWDRGDVRHVMDLLHVAHHPHSDLHCRRLLQHGGLDRADLARAEVERSGLRPSSLWDWACAKLPPGHRARQQLQQVDQLRHADRAGDTVRTLLEACASGNLCPPSVAGLVPEDLRLHELSGWLASPEAREPEQQPEPGALELRTIHGAKGMEWPSVLLLGAEEGMLPVGRATTPQQIDEERRLLYVAASRARDHLIIHASRVRPGYHGQQIETRPSRFLAECGLGEE